MAALQRRERRYSVLSRAWYGKSTLSALADSGEVDSISVGLYYSDGSTTGEFQIGAYLIGGLRHYRVSLFDDAWHLLVPFSDLLQDLALLGERKERRRKQHQHRNEQVTLEEIEEILKRNGFRDATETVAPPGFGHLVSGPEPVPEKG